MTNEVVSGAQGLRVIPRTLSPNLWQLNFDGGQWSGKRLTIQADVELHHRSGGDWAACWAAAFSARWGYPAVAIDAPVDVMLGPAVQAHADLYAAWDCSPPLAIALSELVAHHEGKQERRVTGLFFSGGVDSTYSLWKLLETFDPSDLALVYNAFSAREADRTATQEVRARAAAAAAGVPIIVVRTNVGEAIRQDFSGYWSIRENGEVLAGIAHALSGQIETMFIAASLSPNDLVPNGSHPVGDSMLSSTRLGIFNHGAEKTRLEKIRYLLDRNEGVLPEIDVCAFWFARDAVEFVNCGQCEKCVRTLAEVHVLRGRVQRQSFRHPLSSQTIDGLKELPTSAITSRYWAEIEALLDDTDPLRESVCALLNRLEQSIA